MINLKINTIYNISWKSDGVTELDSLELKT